MGMVPKTSDIRLSGKAKGTHARKTPLLSYSGNGEWGNGNGERCGKHPKVGIQKMPPEREQNKKIDCLTTTNLH